ncbi:UNVERIFIED_CONTAM: hypothetical protein FKN15_057038 [Acipenser sinensis]
MKTKWKLWQTGKPLHPPGMSLRQPAINDSNYCYREHLPRSTDSHGYTCKMRYLSHTELSPLRAPLIPMEHCTTRFFDQCDTDNDKYIALEEWAGCFSLKEQDVDKDLVI